MGKGVRALLAPAGALLALSAAAAGCAPASDTAPQVLRLRSGNLSRQALLLPSGSAGPAPLVLAFHGLGDSGQGLREALGDLPARSGASFVLPDALPCLDTGGARCWPAEDGAPNLSAELAFVDALVERAAERVPVDRGRVFALGYSNGAGWTVRLALSRPALLRGAVVVAGFDPTRRFARDRLGLLALPLAPEGPSRAAPPARHVPVAAVHGGADEVVPPRLGRDLVDRLRALGWPAERVRLETIPGAGHLDPRLLAPGRLLEALRWAERAGEAPG